MCSTPVATPSTEAWMRLGTMHSGDFDRSGISRSRTVLGLSLYGERNWPEWITFRPLCEKVHPSHWMTHLGPPMMTRGVVESEGNALPRRLATFCALFSTIMHGARLCLVAENGLDQERSTEPPLPGIFLPRHILTMEKISASPMWRRRNALAGHDLCPPVVEEIF